MNNTPVKTSEVTQKMTDNDSVSIIKWYSKKPPHNKSTAGIIGTNTPIKLRINNILINVQYK